MKIFKKFSIYSLLILFGATLFTSCSTSNDVVSNSVIQKRKYRSGYFVSKKSDKVTKVVSETTVVRTDIALENSPTQPEIISIPESKTKLKVIEKVAERIAQAQDKRQARKSTSTTQVQRDVRRTQADFSTEVATAVLVQQREMDENLKAAIIFGAISAGVSIVASIVAIITGSGLFYYLLLLAALAIFAYAVYRLVLFFMEM
jgi:glutamate synthase domain-containing protein 2